jgi:hypothetical protein
MNPLSRLVRLPIKALDAILRRYYGVWEFTQDPDCILRVSVSRSPITMTLIDGVQLQAGDPVGLLHLWNERIPAAPAGTPKLHTAFMLMRGMQRSLRMLAAYAETEPRLRDAVAFGGETTLFSLESLGRPQDLIARFGASYVPVHAKPGLLKRLDFFFQRGYAWVLVWTFNPDALRWKTFDDAGRGDVWLSRRQLMKQYGGVRQANGTAMSAEGR